MDRIKTFPWKNDLGNLEIESQNKNHWRKTICTTDLNMLDENEFIAEAYNYIKYLEKRLGIT